MEGTRYVGTLLRVALSLHGVSIPWDNANPSRFAISYSVCGVRVKFAVEVNVNFDVIFARQWDRHGR